MVSIRFIHPVHAVERISVLQVAVVGVLVIVLIWLIHDILLHMLLSLLEEVHSLSSCLQLVLHFGTLLLPR